MHKLIIILIVSILSFSACSHSIKNKAMSTENDAEKYFGRGIAKEKTL